MRLAAVAVILVLGGLLLAAIPIASEEAVHGAYNRGPEGTSELLGPGASLVHGRILEAPEGTLVIAGPELPYSLQEAQVLRSFVEGGGRILIVDDLGSARGLLAAMDIGVALAGVPVYTPVYDDDPGSPIVTATLPGAPASVALADATAVIGDGEPVLLSHGLSWLDEDADGRPGLNEPQGRFAFGMLQTHGAGEVLVIGSAAVLDNEGHPLREALLAWAGPKITVDEGHRRTVDPIGMSAILSGQATWAWVWLAIAAAVVAFQTFQVRSVRVRSRRRPVQAPPHILEELQ